MHNFRTLNVWQKARVIFKDIYMLTKSFPKEELFGITSQMRRCSLSISSNIAEGCGRGTDKEFCRFLDIANGSAFELETQLILSNDILLISDNVLISLEKKIHEIQKMLIKLKESKQST